MTESRFFKLPANLAAQKDLPSGAKVIWAVLANRIGGNGFCWAGVRSIARDAGVDVSTVLESIRKLEDAGRLRVERRGSGRANHYSLTASESAGEIQALGKSKRSENPNSGAGKIQAQALGKSQHNRIEPFNKTQRVRPQGKFSPPTALQVEEYANAIDFPLDAEKFVSHYAANGWMRGKTKMRDWRAAVRYWKATENGNNEHRSGKIRDRAEPVGEFVR
jgi:hypothetical protein